MGRRGRFQSAGYFGIRRLEAGLTPQTSFGGIMSSGHGREKEVSFAKAIKVISLTKVRVKMSIPYTVDREHDLPYLGGYSKDGTIIYIDRHFPGWLKIGRKEHNTLPFLLTHEHVEKSLIDALDYTYYPAHDIATAIEKYKVEAAGIRWQAYSLALDPFIKKDEHEKLERIPRDLDMTPYIGSEALERHMREHMVP